MRLATRYFRLLAATCLALAAAGCTGSNLLPTGNSSLALSFEVVGEDALPTDYECANVLINEFTVRPLDGICAPAAVNAGDPCLNESDCGGAVCEGSGASPLIDNDIDILGSDPNAASLAANILGQPCQLSLRCGGENDGDVCETDAECAPDACLPVFGGNWEAETFVAPAAQPLSEGLYRVNKLSLDLTMWSDLPTVVSCSGSFFSVADAYGGDLVFMVPESGSTDLVFRIDIADLEALALVGCNNAEQELIRNAFECLTCEGAP